MSNNITDKNIDTESIKCWCIFGEPDDQLSEAEQSKFTTAMKKAGTGLKNAYNYVASKLGRAVKHATVGSKHNSLAFMTFSSELEDGNTHRYVFTFNYKKCRWYFLNAGMEMKNSSNVFPSTTEIMSFLKTKTCKQFINSCSKYISPWLKDTNKLDKAAYSFQHVGGDVVKMLNTMKDKADDILKNMFDGETIVNYIVQK